jgi:hypothetical protein
MAGRIFGMIRHGLGFIHAIERQSTFHKFSAHVREIQPLQNLQLEKTQYCTEEYSTEYLELI